MRLFEYQGFPNPRRVRMFLAEKGIDVERVQVDVPGGEHRSEAFRTRNPEMTVPCLELDDGSHISGCVAISRYFEEAFPEVNLMGSTPAEQGLVATWQRRVEAGLMDTVATYFHHATPGLGVLETYQNPEWGQRAGDRAYATLMLLDQELSHKAYVAGDSFTIADITAFSGISFGLFCKLFTLEETPNVLAWYDRIAARPSASA